MQNIIKYFKKLYIVKDIKLSPFLNLTKKRYFGKIIYGCPYFYPKNHNKYIIQIYKQLPKFNSNKYFKIFNYYITYGSPIVFKTIDLGWKDKYDTPRYEWSPAKYLFIGPFQYVIFYQPNIDNNDIDNYFEQYLWYRHYSNYDIINAQNTWPWVSNKISTWNNNFIK